ncbi:hypothetical protein [Nocardiopsis lambiniae]|uniref:Uncharacterized protein n=1 Tax=Nocardiopsis lambiniae TaxID=3075539 RepID=A0ABU2M6J3_9ACTN|nr:hypothetical protein [Nocardiopsis sp. DSM 44743]MDT0328290.1 hypothetical protein [Nocardiopsis sp. DSM 44743]
MKKCRARYVGRHRKKLGPWERLWAIALFAVKAVIIGTTVGLIRVVFGQTIDLQEVIALFELLLLAGDRGDPRGSLESDHP